MMEHVRRGSRVTRHGTIPHGVTSHSSTSQDDAFHEIQLNGKQLFFLFMAATVVSVVIFLCGVLVGRGVRAERTAADLEAVNTPPSADPPPPSGTQGSAGADPTIILPPPPAEEISEVSPNTPVAGAEERKPAARTEKPAPSVKPEKAEAPAPKPAAAAPRPAPTSGTSRPAAGVAAAADAAPSSSTASAPGDWFVQVAAVNQKSDADSYVKRLAAKGYTARIVPPSDGVVYFRVRVGAFKTKPEAQLLADKLKRDVGVTPYVNR